jgi:DNA-binding MarR family transcriptional regulator
MNELFPLLKKINIILIRRINKLCQSYGITGKQFMLLNYLYHKECEEKDKFMQKMVEQEFQVRRSTVTSIMQTLEKKGFIMRSTDALDQRKKVIKLTEKAKEIIKLFKAEKLHNDSVLFSIFNQDEYDTLVTLLKRIYDSFAE